MAKSVGIRELRQNLSKYLRLVKAGESLTVTERGRKVARVVPLAGNEFHEMLAELHGVTIPRGKGKLSDTLKRLDAEGRFPQTTSAGTTDAFLDESRRDY